jgi:hypothetical protein
MVEPERMSATASFAEFQSFDFERSITGALSAGFVEIHRRRGELADAVTTHLELNCRGPGRYAHNRGYTAL